MIPFQATVVCDLVLLYLLPKREFYKNMKFKYTDTQSQVRCPRQYISCNMVMNTRWQKRVRVSKLEQCYGLSMLSTWKPHNT